MGLIGRNGTGKTTTLKTMLRFVHPHSGNVEINGLDVEKNELKVKESIDFISGLDGFYNSKKLKLLQKLQNAFFPTGIKLFIRNFFRNSTLMKTNLPIVKPVKTP